jgi:hypothetical protein
MPDILARDRARCKAPPLASHILGRGAHPGPVSGQAGRRFDTNVTDTSPMTATAANA